MGRVLYLFFLVTWLTALEMPARAQTAQSPDAAVNLGYRALEALRAKDLPLALLLFREAERAAHSPVFVLHIGRTLLALKQFHAAIDEFDSCRDESLATTSPPAFLAAQQECRQERARLISRLPRVDLSPWRHTNASSPYRVAQVTGTGRHSFATGDPSKMVLLLDPGSYQITMETVLGERRTVHLPPLDAGSIVVVPVPQGVQLSRPDRKNLETDSPRGTELPVWTALALAGAGFAAASGFTIAAAELGAKLDESCSASPCTQADRPQAEQARLMARMANVGLAIGGVGLATGLTLWFLRPSESPAMDGTAASAQSSAAFGATLGKTF